MRFVSKYTCEYTRIHMHRHIHRRRDTQRFIASRAVLKLWSPSFAVCLKIEIIALQPTVPSFATVLSACLPIQWSYTDAFASGFRFLFACLLNACARVVRMSIRSRLRSWSSLFILFAPGSRIHNPGCRIQVPGSRIVLAVCSGSLARNLCCFCNTCRRNSFAPCLLLRKHMTRLYVLLTFQKIQKATTTQKNTNTNANHKNADLYLHNVV